MAGSQVGVPSGGGGGGRQLAWRHTSTADSKQAAAVGWSGEHFRELTGGRRMINEPWLRGPGGWGGPTRAPQPPSPSPPPVVEGP